MPTVTLSRLTGETIGTGETVRAICEANRVHLRGANLRDADLGSAYLRGADLGSADLGGAYLRDADLGGADLRGADLRGADLGGANLGDAYLRGADLRGANLGGAYLRGADLRDADLGGADLGGVADAVDLGTPHDWRVVAVRHADCVMIAAGCRWLSYAEAVAHWRELRGRAEMRACLDYLKAIAAVRGWTL